MSEHYQAECTNCGWTGPIRNGEQFALGDFKRLHKKCWPQCQGCGRNVPMLVEDGDLCIRCDRFHFPEVLTDKVAC